ncbi:hypothetical protein JCM10207_002544 [Rhodosporidiobolus poonsookiae]
MATASYPSSAPVSRPVSPSSSHSSSSARQLAPPARPKTVLPPLSSLSLPGSPLTTPGASHTATFPSVLAPVPVPELHHPRPTYPPPAPSAAPPLLAPQPGPVPAPEIYARAYEMLRERWAGCEANIREVADAATAALEAQQERQRKRSRSWEVDEFEAERGAQDKRPRKVEPARQENGLESLATAAVEFYDNPAPAAHEASQSTHLAQSAARRHRSASPLPPLHTVIPRGTLPPSTRPHLNDRKRSFSLPSGPRPPPPSHPSSHLSPSSIAHRSSTLPNSRSTPHLASNGAALADQSNGGRSEALLGVVRSFEAVLACRAEGWRRLAGRASQ